MLLDELCDLIERDPEAKPDGGRIDAFEAETGYRLPSALRSILTQADGGQLKTPVGAQWACDRYRGGVASIYLEQFYGFGCERKLTPLSVHIEDMEYQCDGVPSGIFCFADDWCGNVVTVDLREDSYGTVACVDHETVGDRFEDPETYQIICDTFDDFISMLQLAGGNDENDFPETLQ